MKTNIALLIEQSVNVIDSLNKGLRLTPEEQQFFCEHFEREEIKKNEFTIRIGDYEKYLYFIESGKYFAIIPALFMVAIPQLAPLNIMGLHSPESAILSAIIFNAIIIPILIPLALKGVQYKPIGASALLRRNLLIYGLGGVIAPFIGIKLIDMIVSLFFQ